MCHLFLFTRQLGFRDLSKLLKGVCWLPGRSFLVYNIYTDRHTLSRATSREWIHSVRVPLYACHISGTLKESLLLDAHSQRNGQESMCIGTF